MRPFYCMKLFVGSTAFVMDVWPEKSAPYVQMMYVTVLVGCTVSPQMAKPFLSEARPPLESTLQELSSNESQGLIHEEQSTTHGMSESRHGELNSSNVEDAFSGMGSGMDVESSESDVQFAYITVGCLLLAGAVFHWVIFCLSRCNTKHIHLKRGPSATPAKGDNIKNGVHHKRSRILKVLIICALGSSAVVFGGYEDTVSNFVLDYATKGLNWDKRTGADMVSVFWAADSMSRILGLVFLLQGSGQGAHGSFGHHGNRVQLPNDLHNDLCVCDLVDWNYWSWVRVRLYARLSIDSHQRSDF